MDPIILRRDQQVEIELQEKSKWVRLILGKLGLPVDQWKETLSMDDLRKIRMELKALGIDIIDDSDNGIEIYVKDELIAEWRRPHYILKLNPKERDSRYKYYLEMHLRSKSVYT